MARCEALFGGYDESTGGDDYFISKNELVHVIFNQFQIDGSNPKDDFLVKDNTYKEGPYDKEDKLHLTELFEGGSEANTRQYASRRNYSSRINVILGDLIERGYLTRAHPIWDRKAKPAFICQLTAQGISLAISSSALLNEFPVNNPNTCFVIMSFSGDHRLEDFYNFGIKSAVEALGYKCVRTDKIEYNGKITDMVLEQLLQSKFIVADLTEARPNCYYELGYAHHAKIPVILTIHAESTIHFDVKDYNFIVYKSATELNGKLSARIAATVAKKA